MANSLYIASIEPRSGKSVVALGIMEMLSRRVCRMGYFRPIIPTDSEPDNNIELIRQRYDLDQAYKESFALTHDAAQELFTGDHRQAAMKHIVDRFKQRQTKSRFILCEGTDFTGVSSAFEFDINAEIAANLGSPIMLVINAKEKSAQGVVEAIHLGIDSFSDKGCVIAAVMVNRVEESAAQSIHREVAKHPPIDAQVYLLTELPILGRPTVRDIARALDAEILQGNDEALHRPVADFKVAAMSIPNFLDLIEEADLIITPGDRSDVILGSMTASISDNFPAISGLMLTGGMKPEPPVKRLIEGATSASMIPIISVKTDTFTGAMNAGNVRAVLQPAMNVKSPPRWGISKNRWIFPNWNPESISYVPRDARPSCSNMN